MPAPATHDFVHLEISSASVLNAGVNSPINYLIGRAIGSDDAIELEDSLEILSGSAGDRYVRLPQGTTGQRPTGAAGLLRFNTNEGLLDFHDGTDWGQVLAASLVNFETLDTNGDVGSAADQLAEGNHQHMYSSEGAVYSIRVDEAPTGFTDIISLSPTADYPIAIATAGNRLFHLYIRGSYLAGSDVGNTTQLRVVNENDSDAVIVTFPEFAPYTNAIRIFVEGAYVPANASLKLQYNSPLRLNAEALVMSVFEITTT